MDALAMRPLLLALLVALAVPRVVLGRCDDNPGDATAIVAARAGIESACDCTGASSHRAYVRCAVHQTRALVSAHELPRNCKGAVVRWAAGSTCGKPEPVTCCRTSAAGETTCKVKRDSMLCIAPRGGDACVGVFPSCRDACTASGCATTTTSTTATNTTMTTQPVCGDGVCNGTETCSTCCQDCGTCLAVCGNGVCEAGETVATCPADCEPSAIPQLPIVVAAGQLSGCAASASVVLAPAFGSSCWSCLSSGCSASSSGLIALLPPACGGNGAPTLHGGDVVPTVGGQTSADLQAIKNCVQNGVTDYTVAVVADPLTCTTNATVTYFARIHVNSVTDNGTNQGIDATQICPSCGEGACSDGDTCSSCAADCGGCPATCP